MSRGAREAWGRWAESLAAWSLRLRGYRIVARRFRTPLGEIDLIAQRGRLVAFVEVKARTDLEQALVALTCASANAPPAPPSCSCCAAPTSPGTRCASTSSRCVRGACRAIWSTPGGSADVRAGHRRALLD